MPVQSQVYICPPVFNAGMVYTSPPPPPPRFGEMGHNWCNSRAAILSYISNHSLLGGMGFLMAITQSSYQLHKMQQDASHWHSQLIFLNDLNLRLLLPSMLAVEVIAATSSVLFSS